MNGGGSLDSSCERRMLRVGTETAQAALWSPESALRIRIGCRIVCGMLDMGEL